MPLGLCCECCDEAMSFVKLSGRWNRAGVEAELVELSGSCDKTRAVARVAWDKAIAANAVAFAMGSIVLEDD